MRFDLSAVYTPEQRCLMQRSAATVAEYARESYAAYCTSLRFNYPDATDARWTEAIRGQVLSAALYEYAR